MTARVTFNSAANSVTMTVSCSAGVPTATSNVGGSGGWGTTAGVAATISARPG